MDSSVAVEKLQREGFEELEILAKSLVCINEFRALWISADVFLDWTGLEIFDQQLTDIEI